MWYSNLSCHPTDDMNLIADETSSPPPRISRRKRQPEEYKPSTKSKTFHPAKHFYQPKDDFAWIRDITVQCLVDQEGFDQLSLLSNYLGSYICAHHWNHKLLVQQRLDSDQSQGNLFISIMQLSRALHSKTCHYKLSRNTRLRFQTGAFNAQV